MSEGSASPARVSVPAGRHRLVAAGAALGVVLGMGTLLWGPAVRERWVLLDDARPPGGPEATPAEARSETVRLAFLAPDGRTLEEEPRELTLQSSAPAAARAILEALRTGSRQGRGAVLPPPVQVRHVFVDKRGVAYVDLSPELLQPSGAPGGSAAPPGRADGGLRPGEAETWHPIVLAAQAIAATLGMNLQEIAQVQVLVEGREVPLVTDGVDLRRPLPASLPIRPPGTPQ